MVSPVGRANHNHKDRDNCLKECPALLLHVPQDSDELPRLSELCSHHTWNMVGVVSEPHLNSGSSSQIHQMDWFLQNTKW